MGDTARAEHGDKEEMGNFHILVGLRLNFLPVGAFDTVGVIPRCQAEHRAQEAKHNAEL